MKNSIMKIFLDNSLQDWGITLGIILASIFALKIIKGIAIVRIKKWTAKTATTFDDFIVSEIDSSVLPMLYTFSIYFSSHYLTLPEKAVKIINVATSVVITFYLLRITINIIRQTIFTYIRKQENSAEKEGQAKGLIVIIKLVVWALGIIFLIDNLGYDVTTLVAGLGIGGIAIALAAQTILGDLFSYFVIFFDRPFEIGDFIVVGDKNGTVEYVGVKTTRIRTLSGEQLICSNTDLTNARLHNYKRMEERRVLFKLGVVYQTSYDQLVRIPEIVKRIIEKTTGTRFDRGHFTGYGDFSLNFEFVYYILGPDYNLYMNLQQEIYLDIYRAFEKEKIEFAYPTQTVIISKDTA